MNATQFITKIKSMKKQHMKALEKECLRLFNCGGVNTEEYEDNYLLPKIIMCVALLNESYQYNPFSDEDKQTIHNLKRF